jgi:hypothetical protein
VTLRRLLARGPRSARLSLDKVLEAYRKEVMRIAEPKDSATCQREEEAACRPVVRVPPLTGVYSISSKF